ncbi:TonB-linked outer membrane protein, SusC/RagA family [bacterium A37T11]|nr:TonB-linked outer membrane protein, SusC/RagA family [bacterium A37T11]
MEKNYFKMDFIRKWNLKLVRKVLVIVCLLLCFIKPVSAKDNRVTINWQQDTLQVKGTVTDTSGNPMMGVSVFIKGTSKGAVTDAKGNYNLKSINHGAQLIFSFIGYQTLIKPVNNFNKIDVMLYPDDSQLEEVVVTALGIKREEKSLGYSVQSVATKDLVSAKSVDVATKLTGKVAGLNVKNSTEFNASPTIELRGESALLVIDGVPFENLSLNDIAADDIASITVLKGATASALYGSRGGNGAIMIQTKRGNQEGGLDVSFNSSTMFTSGFLAFPKVQTSYSSGSSGKYRVGDYVWGDKLDIGRTASQYNPYTYEMEDQELVSKGKDNLSNFLETSYISNNNINISQQGKYGGVRSSITYVKNKGQYPNTMLNKFTASLAGNMKAGNFDMDAGFTYNKRYFPNNIGTGYGGNGYLYNLVVWSGSEFDVRDYKNYWIKGKEDQEQNWMDKVWYSNPYFIANEMLNSEDYDVTNGFVTANYKILPWLNATLRSGIDYYAQQVKRRDPIGTVGDVLGFYSKTSYSGYSLNNDLILSANHSWGDFKIDGLVGGSIFYLNDNRTYIGTKNGLSVPGFYSIYASVDQPEATEKQSQRQVNGLYGKASLSWKDQVFVDVTGRNDWNSTLNKEERSYFYPSVAGSWVLSQSFKLPELINLLKVRGSWTKTKFAPEIYDINTTYALSVNAWDGLTAANYPTTIRDKGIKPESVKSFETGLAAGFLNNRINLDVAYYQNLSYDNIKSASVSGTSGFNSTYINTDEQLMTKGYEITLGSQIFRKKDFSWDIIINWSTNKKYYHQLDPEFSSDYPWITKGSRYDWISIYDYDRDANGNIIHKGGYPVVSKYPSLLGYSNPDWITGMTNNFRWKDFGFSFTIDGRFGGKMFNSMNQALWNSGAHIDSDNSYRYDQVVNGLNNYIGQGVVVKSGSVEKDTYGNILPGTDTRIFETNTAAVSYESYMKNTNPYIGSKRIQNYYDPTFLKLRDLTITYNLPTNIAKKISMKTASISLVGQNLLMWTKEFKYSDPDVGSDDLNSPSVRYIGGNIKFSF